MDKPEGFSEQPVSQTGIEVGESFWTDTEPVQEHVCGYINLEMGAIRGQDPVVVYRTSKCFKKLT